jgi:20S proteasome alpha/beta subunit
MTPGKAEVIFVILLVHCILGGFGDTLAACKKPGGLGIIVGCTRRGGALLGNTIIADGNLPLYSKVHELVAGSVILCSVDISRDVDLLKRDLRHAALDYEVVAGRKMSIRSISSLARRLIHKKYRSAHVIIAGKSFRNHGYERFDSYGSMRNNDRGHTKDMMTLFDYYLYEIFPGGGLVEQKHSACLGSGSALLQSDLEFTQDVTNNTNLMQLVKDALNRVSRADIFSGGGVDMLEIS